MAKGVVTEGWVADTIGAIMTLTGSIWSLLDKNKQSFCFGSKGEDLGLSLFLCVLSTLDFY